MRAPSAAAPRASSRSAGVADMYESDAMLRANATLNSSPTARKSATASSMRSVLISESGCQSATHDENASAIARARGESCWPDSRTTLHPGLHLRQQAADPPVEEQAPHDVGDDVDLADRDQVTAPGAEVVAFRLEPVEGGGLRRASEQQLGLGGEADVVLGVRASHRRGIRVELEACGCDLAHRDQHREERQGVLVVLPQKAAVDELEEGAEQVGGPWFAGGDGLDRIEAEVAGEHPEPLEERARVGAQQVDAPLDRRLDRPLALGHVARRGDEQRQHPVEPREHGRGGEGADACGGELDRKRNAFERPADAGRRPRRCHRSRRTWGPRTAHDRGTAARRAPRGSPGSTPARAPAEGRVVRRRRPVRRAPAAERDLSRGRSRRAGR